MSTRISSALGLLLLAACNRGEGAATPAPRPEDKIECALHGAASFARDCVVEHHGSEVIIRHPDGGFRRFEVTNGGLTTADGAQDAILTPRADGVEAAVGDDRYRLPSTMVPDGK